MLTHPRLAPEEGGTRLLEWARTGVLSYEYESAAARAAAIEQGAEYRPATALVAGCAQLSGRVFRRGGRDADAGLAADGALDHGTRNGRGLDRASRCDSARFLSTTWTWTSATGPR